MEIALVIVGGIIILTVVTMVGDYFTKTKLAQRSGDPEVVQKLEARVAELERRVQDQDAKLGVLENDVSFTAKLLEKRPQ